MNKITVPALLAVTVMIAGIFAFMPVQEASTVHTGATFPAVIDGTNISFDTLTLGDPVIFDADADKLVLLDIHEDVSDGFVVIRTDNTVDCTKLQIAVTNIAGLMQGTATTMTLLDAATAQTGATNERLCHGHIPTDGNANSVLIALHRLSGNAVTIPAHSTITTTIESITDASVAG